MLTKAYVNWAFIKNNYPGFACTKAKLRGRIKALEEVLE